MSKRKNLYLSKSGQFAIMAEFLERGWNTCTPDVDVGTMYLCLKTEQVNLNVFKSKRQLLSKELMGIVQNSMRL